MQDNYLKTSHQCCKKASETDSTLVVLHHALSSSDAISWLASNGGGVYRNIEHNFIVEIPAK